MADIGRGCALCVTDGDVNGRPFPVCTEKCTAEIRGLSIKQPYAWAITVGAKPVENRTRGTRYRGLLAIHASKSVMAASLDDPRILDAIAVRDFEIGEAASATGAVVAVAELTGCHHSDECMMPVSQERGVRTGCSAWAVRGQWHIEIRVIRALPEPVPCRGMLGLWRLPPDVEAKVRRQLEAPGV